MAENLKFAGLEYRQHFSQKDTFIQKVPIIQ